MLDVEARAGNLVAEGLSLFHPTVWNNPHTSQRQNNWRREARCVAPSSEMRQHLSVVRPPLILRTSQAPHSCTPMDDLTSGSQLPWANEECSMHP